MVNKWIYPLKNKLTHTEKEVIFNELNQNLKDWNSHGKPIQYSVQMLFNQVIIIEAITETSGCSIDYLQKKVYEVLHHHRIEILPNHYVLYLKNEKELGYFDFRETQNFIKNQEITIETPILDTQKILEGNQSYYSILRDSWLVRYC